MSTRYPVYYVWILAMKICRNICMFFILTISGVTIAVSQYQFTEILFPKTEYLTTTLRQSQNTVWAVSQGQGASVWLDSTANWKEIAKFNNTIGFLKAECAFGNGDLAILRSTGTIEILGPLGDREFNSIQNPDLYLMPRIAALNHETIVFATINTFNKTLVSSLMTTGSIQSLSPIEINNVVDMWFFDRVNCSPAILTVIDKDDNGNLDTSEIF